MYAAITSLVIFASPNVFTVINSLALNGLILSYLICIATVVWAKLFRVDEEFPKGKFTLGRRKGLFINCVGLVFMTLVLVFNCFPTSADPGVNDMNWSVVVMGATWLFLSVYYCFWGRHPYKAPVDRAKKAI